MTHERRFICVSTLFSFSRGILWTKVVIMTTTHWMEHGELCQLLHRMCLGLLVIRIQDHFDRAANGPTEAQ